MVLCVGVTCAFAAADLDFGLGRALDVQLWRAQLQLYKFNLLTRMLKVKHAADGAQFRSMVPWIRDIVSLGIVICATRAHKVYVSTSVVIGGAEWLHAAVHAVLRTERRLTPLFGLLSAHRNPRSKTSLRNREAVLFGIQVSSEFPLQNLFCFGYAS